MREEISEPQHWRLRSRGSSTARGTAWSAQRRSDTPFPTEVVDAAFTDETILVEPVRGSRRDLASQDSTSEGELGTEEVSSATVADVSTSRSDLAQSLSTQLAMLDAQREQLQHLLAQAEGKLG